MHDLASGRSDVCVCVSCCVLHTGYSLLTMGLGASQAHHRLGTLWGRAAPPGVRMFSIFNALGQMAFAYGCAVVQLEVQDTLKEPPGEQQCGDVLDTQTDRMMLPPPVSKSKQMLPRLESSLCTSPRPLCMFATLHYPMLNLTSYTTSQ